MTDLRELIERIERAEGPDREIDEAILKAIGWYKADAGARFGPGSINSRVTASLDAALVLVERVLPDAYPDIYRNVTSPSHPRVKAWSAILSDRGCYAIGVATDDVTAPTPALALCLALLKAMQAKEKP